MPHGCSLTLSPWNNLITHLTTHTLCIYLYPHIWTTKILHHATRSIKSMACLHGLLQPIFYMSLPSCWCCPSADHTLPTVSDQPPAALTVLLVLVTPPFGKHNLRPPYPATSCPCHESSASSALTYLNAIAFMFVHVFNCESSKFLPCSNVS